MHFVAGAAHESETVAELPVVQVQRPVHRDAQSAIAGLRPGIGGDTGRNQAQQREEDARAEADAAGGVQESLDTGHELVPLAACDVDWSPGAARWRSDSSDSASASRRGAHATSEASWSAICSRSMRMRCDSHHTTGW